MKVLIDGVAFASSRRARGGPSPVADQWETVIRHLAREADLHIELLDRGGAPAVEGVASIGFPSYCEDHAPADSLLLQQMATHEGADAFVSTGWTTPTTTPSVAVLMAEMLEPPTAMSTRQAGECALSILHASSLICVGGAAVDALGRHRDRNGEQPTAPPEVATRVDEVGPMLASALRSAAASSPDDEEEFHRRWAAIRRIQADIDG